MSCGVDVGCYVAQSLMPLLLPVVFLVVIFFVALLGGKPGKAIAGIGFVLWFAYYVAPLLGYPQFHDLFRALGLAIA